MNTIVRKLAAATWQPLLTRAARAYIAGPQLEHALKLAQTFTRQGSASTLCFWDRVGDSPDYVAGMYCRTLEALAGSRLNSYVSIKAPSLNFNDDLLAGILATAHNGGTRLHFDALGFETADATFCMIDRARASHDALSCTLPGRWLRSVRDADRAVTLQLPVRVVKGQWPDPQAPGRDLRQGFLEVVDALAGRASHVAVATHDPPLAAAAIEKLRRTNTPCELELLFGLPDREVREHTRAFGVPVRYYLPFGHAWLPYALRQAKRNPRILWWVVRDGYLRTPGENGIRAS